MPPLLLRDHADRPEPRRLRGPRDRRATYRPLLGADLAAAAAWVNAQADWGPLEVVGGFMRDRALQLIATFPWTQAQSRDAITSSISTGRASCPTRSLSPAASGDIAVATLAAVLLVAGLPRDARRRLAYGVWNVLGLTDILFVVTTAGRLVTFAPESMAALTRLPLSLLPTFLVPLIIASHVVLGVRLAPTPR